MLSKNDKLLLVSALAKRLVKQLNMNNDILPYRYRDENCNLISSLLTDLSKSIEKEVERGIT